MYYFPDGDVPYKKQGPNVLEDEGAFTTVLFSFSHDLLLARGLSDLPGPGRGGPGAPFAAPGSGSAAASGPYQSTWMIDIPNAKPAGRQQ